MKFRVDKRRWYFALLNVFLVILGVLCLFVFQQIAGTLDSVRAADRWKGESDIRFAQLACFMPVDTPKSSADIIYFRQQLEQVLAEESMDPSGYSDAYSGRAKFQVSGMQGSADASAIGVGGNFFQFHPLQLLSGSYISEKDLMQDRVVLDEVLAWQLFGGYDVSGMTVYIQDQPFYVAGVVRREADFASERAYADGAGMFISYSAFEALTDNVPKIDCYEIVMPDMISGYAMSVVSDRFSVGTGEIVENSSRYDVVRLLETLQDFGDRSMRTNGVIYPYWENAVRLTEDYSMVLLLAATALLITPTVTIFITSIRIAVRGWKYSKCWTIDSIGRISEKRKEKKYWNMVK